jgi:hypothetical protein
MSMETEELTKRLNEAAEELSRHAFRGDAVQATRSLSGGFSVLRDLLYTRVHDDVQSRIGQDSMLTPLSAEKSAKAAKVEIELYLMATSAATVREHGYLAADGDWYLRWLCWLRLGKREADPRLMQRLNYYLSKTIDDQRLAFTNILAKALPESRKAPLVLFRLVPVAVEIITSLTFDDRVQASEARDRQAVVLPAVHDCRQCRGKVLENGEQCRHCGNPLWKFDWLTRAD